MKINFDQKKLKVVTIDEVRPNSWNPKDKNTVEYEKVKTSIQQHGQIQPIVVRENKGYEIIDGEQKWTACKELGFKEVLVYNEGKMGDKEAKELTIAFQQQVPFNDLSLAKLVNEMVISYGEELKIPYTELELKNIESTANYDFDKPPDDWAGMPTFEKADGLFKVNISFENELDRKGFMEKIGVKIINKTVGNTWCIWYPEKERDDVSSIEFE
jgi:hypothetical protein